MTPEAQRIAIAEACEWTHCKIYDGFMVSLEGLPHGTPPKWKEDRIIPDYPRDLNAMHEAEKVLKIGLWTRYVQYLCELGGGSVRFVCCHAPAAHRAEAFLKTLNLWEESK